MCDRQGHQAAADEKDRSALRAQFRQELTALIPHMRAFARGLCGDPAQADDLAQDALARALAAEATFTLGTNMRAWVFTIVRNQFFSSKRRTWREVQLDVETSDRVLVSDLNPTAGLELADVRRAIADLPPRQREALLLVAGGGLSYEQAAEVLSCAVGTIKSRVSRARRTLGLQIDGDRPADTPPFSTQPALRARPRHPDRPEVMAA